MNLSESDHSRQETQRQAIPFRGRRWQPDGPIPWNDIVERSLTMPVAFLRWMIALALVSSLALLPAKAQEKKGSVYDNPKNLKVLPKDIKPEALESLMKEATEGLGVKCTACHVGKQGEPLESFDFASDEKRSKLRARVMFDMVQTINGKFMTEFEQLSRRRRRPQGGEGGERAGGEAEGGERQGGEQGRGEREGGRRRERGDAVTCWTCHRGDTDVEGEGR